MKPNMATAIVAALATFGLLEVGRCADPKLGAPSTSIAYYRNYPEAKAKEGQRIYEIFKAHHIETFPAGASVTVDVVVATAQAEEAQRVLARAIIAEGLHIALIKVSPKDGRVTVVQPETVLGP